FSMDRHRKDKSGATTYWVRGGELLNVWIARYEPDSAAFEQEEATGFPSAARRYSARWATHSREAPVAKICSRWRGLLFVRPSGAFTIVMRSKPGCKVVSVC